MLSKLLRMAFMEFRRGKMKSILYVSLMAICITLLITICNLAFSSYIAMEDRLNRSNTHREVMINIDNRRVQFPLQTYIDSLLSDPNIEEAYPYYSDIFGELQIINNSDKTNMIIKSGSRIHIPTVIAGNDFEEDQRNQIILPSSLRVRQWDNTMEIIDTTSYIGNEIKLYYKDDYEKEEFVYEGTVVGVYAPDLEELINYVYIPLDDYYEIVEHKFAISAEDLFDLQDQYSLIIMTDQYQSVSKVTERLMQYEEYDIIYNMDIIEDIQSMDGVKKVGGLMVMMIIIFTFIIINTTFKGSIEEKIGNIALLKAVGYTDKHLFILIMAEVFALVVVSYVLSIFLSYGLIQIAIKPLIEQLSMQGGIQITTDMNINFLLYEFIILFFISLLSVIKISIKIQGVSAKGLFVQYD